nr:hypothetical protein [Tanacetum cinerariifolium]
MDADEDVTLKDVAAVAKEVENEKDDEVKKDADVQGRPAESQAQIYKIDLEHADKVLSMQDDHPEPAELKEVIKVVTTAKLITEVVTVAAATITVVATVAPPITIVPSAARRRKEVVIRDPEETATPSTIIYSEPKSKDKGKGIMVQEPKPLKKQAQIERQDNVVLRYQALKRKPQTEAQARKNMMIYLKNMAGFKLDYFKEQLEEEESRSLKRKAEFSEEKAAKKQKLDEEVEELRKHLQIVLNDDDDVYTEATPLALKKDLHLQSPRTSQITTLTYMFEKPDVQAQVWKNQRSVHGLAKTYCCQVKLKLLNDAADIKLRLLKQSAAVDEKMKKYC